VTASDASAQAERDTKVDVVWRNPEASDLLLAAVSSLLTV
jgi:hypothetical protein